MAHPYFEDGSGCYADSLMHDWLQLDKKVWSRILVPSQQSQPEDIVSRYNLARKDMISILVELNTSRYFVPPSNQGPKM